MYGESSRLLIHKAKFLGRPVKPIAKDKKADPASINEIMHEVIVAPKRELLKYSKLNCFENTTKLMNQLLLEMRLL